MQNLIALIGFSIVSGILNRLGGVGLKIHLDEKLRDWGCPILAFITMWIFGIHTEFCWSLVAFFLMWGSLASYFDKWGTDGVDWYEWVISGFFQGLSLLPISMYTGKYLGFIIRTIILMVFIPFSNKFQIKFIWDKTDGVEFSRGFIYNITIPLLLL